MAGKNCTGTQNNNAGNLKNSRAFCEGRQYRASGTQLLRPLSSNPHDSNSEAGFAWATGWQFTDSAQGTYVGAFGCCAALGDVPA